MSDRAFYNWSELDWVKHLESQTDIILGEVLSILGPLGDNSHWFQTYPHYVKSEQKTPWKTYELVFFGMQVEANLKQCPETEKILSEIPEVIGASFSLLPSKTHILPHKGYSRMVLRSHLPLIVPEGDLGIRVGTEVRSWEKGKLITFDDSIEHEAWNNSDEYRVVMMLDLPNPQMEYSRDQICKYKIENMDDPFLLELASKEQWMAMYHKGKINLTV